MKCAGIIGIAEQMANLQVKHARNKDQKLVSHFFKDWLFYRLLLCCPIENVWEIWPIKIDFGQPNAEIDRKMASGRLLFLAPKALVR